MSKSSGRAGLDQGKGPGGGAGPVDMMGGLCGGASQKNWEGCLEGRSQIRARSSRGREFAGIGRNWKEGGALGGEGPDQGMEERL